MKKMKIILTLAIAALTFSGTTVLNADNFVEASTNASNEQLLQKYLEIKDAHVASNANDAKKHANELAKMLDDAEDNAALKSAAKKIAGTDKLDEQRKHFEALSEAIYKLAKDEDAFESTLYQQYCPMAFNNKGAFWLSDKEEIRNPYFGDKMLKCGKVKETL